jgi:hypothetical protein
MDQLMQICNLCCNGREATVRLSNLCTLIRKAGTQDRHFVSFPVFLDSTFVVTLGRNAFAHSNSNRSPDL